MEFLENTDMLTAFFGQDDCFTFPQEGQKNDDGSIENVLVEKFGDYGVTTGHRIDTSFEGHDDLFDNEWMTSKIDLTSLSGHLDSNFNVVETEVLSTSAIKAALLGNEVNDDKKDATDVGSSTLGLPLWEDDAFTSNEQHVPDIDGIGEQFKSILDSYLAAAKASEESRVNSVVKNDIEMVNDDVITVNNVMVSDNLATVDDVFTVATSAITKFPTKRKLPDSEAQGPKVKVKTPEQKERKRQQNRSAATKYRSKKRSEQETLNAQCSELENENTKLRGKIESKQQEIQYLKNLIIDVFNKKPARI